MTLASRDARFEVTAGVSPASETSRATSPATLVAQGSRRLTRESLSRSRVRPIASSIMVERRVSRRTRIVDPLSITTSVHGESHALGVADVDDLALATDELAQLERALPARARAPDDERGRD